MPVDGPSVHYTTIHHEESASDLTSFPTNRRGGAAMETILDAEANRKEKKAKEEQEKESRIERPPGLWLITIPALYYLYRWLS